MRSLIRSSQSLLANMIYANEQNELCYDEGYDKLKIFYDTHKRAVFCWNAKEIKPEMNLKALDTSSRSCRCRGSSSWHWPRHLHLLLLLLVLLLRLPLVLLLKVPLLPTTPCSNQANLAPLPSSLTSSPAYTTLQSPDFKRNLKFRSSEFLSPHKI